MKRAFQVKRSYRKILRNRKRRIERRLAPKQWSAQAQPMLRGGNIHYEMAAYQRYVGYEVLAFNLHQIGRELSDEPRCRHALARGAASGGCGHLRRPRHPVPAVF